MSSTFNPAGSYPVVPGMTIQGAFIPGAESVFTTEALAFVADLARTFEDRRKALVEARSIEQERLDAGGMLDFLPETLALREGEWSVGPIPTDLQNRRVEITGPVERKMIINALNSGANVFMADFEDSLSPLWEAVVQGQINLAEAVRRSITFINPAGKSYQLNKEIAVLFVRPRGLHLCEKHLLVDGMPIAGAFLDFSLYCFINAEELLSRDSGPYFYLPKLEHYKEAELWRDVFQFAEKRLALTQGTIKATVLIETINAAFQMDEILHALQDHCVGLNCGRWDYIFSFIKKFNSRADFVLPDRAAVDMTQPFLRSYSKLLIQTTHKRGAFAMGGMAAFIPVKNDEEANAKAIAAVQADKEREVGDGCDGTWVAHPALVPVAKEVFDRHMPQNNQLGRRLDNETITAADLLAVPQGNITESGLRNNLSVSLQYIAAWLGGNGCVPINNLMEDAATAEIARSQVWQWIHHHGRLQDGREVTSDLVKLLLEEERQAVQTKLGQAYNVEHYTRAVGLLNHLLFTAVYTDFLTVKGYQLLE